MNTNVSTKGFLIAGAMVALIGLPVLAQGATDTKTSPKPAKVKVETHYLVPVRSGPNAARPGHPGKPFEMTEIKTTSRPAVAKAEMVKTRRTVKTAHHARGDRYAMMRRDILEAARAK